MGWFVERLALSKHRKAHRSVLHPEVDYFINFITFFATIVISVHECLTGEGFEKPLRCAPVPGGAPGYALAQALHGQAALKTEEGYGGGSMAVRLNKSGRFREMPFELTPRQLNTVHHASRLRLTF